VLRLHSLLYDKFFQSAKISLQKKAIHMKLPAKKVRVLHMRGTKLTMRQEEGGAKENALGFARGGGGREQKKPESHSKKHTFFSLSLSF